MRPICVNCGNKRVAIRIRPNVAGIHRGGAALEISEIPEYLCVQCGHRGYSALVLDVFNTPGTWFRPSGTYTFDTLCRHTINCELKR